MAVAQKIHCQMEQLLYLALDEYDPSGFWPMGLAVWIYTHTVIFWKDRQKRFPLCICFILRKMTACKHRIVGGTG